MGERLGSVGFGTCQDTRKGGVLRKHTRAHSQHNHRHEARPGEEHRRNGLPSPRLSIFGWRFRGSGLDRKMNYVAAL
jgi:hypothetical protein